MGVTFDPFDAFAHSLHKYVNVIQIDKSLTHHIPDISLKTMCSLFSFERMINNTQQLYDVK